MATRLYFRADNAIGLGIAPTNAERILSSTRGTITSIAAANTVIGPTSGVTIRTGTGGIPIRWWSPRFDAFTLSGAITFNLRMRESSLSANTGAQVKLWRTDFAGNVIEPIIDSEFGTELSTAPQFPAQNWSPTPPSAIVFQTGDRILAQVFGNDAGGTMASGFSFSFGYNGSTANVNGDSWLELTETATLLNTPGLLPIVGVGRGSAP